ncbi:MAG: hypothetical protein D3914_17555 [Candidatus Electrothrix sp. LOE2]|nr:hypothetical protein [Candidatus Electrothrix sp. LOE2]
MILFWPQNVFPVDVSKFDIKGIKLGDNYFEIANKIPCNNPEIKKHYVDDNSKYVYNTRFKCNYKKNGFFYFAFWNDKKVSEIEKVFWFQDVQPDHEQMIKKIISKYGKPTVSGKSIQVKGKEKSFKMCWGDCESYSQKNNRYWDGRAIHPGDNEKSLLIELSTGRAIETILILSLKDPVAIEKGEKWREKMELEIKKQKSNIDF